MAREVVVVLNGETARFGLSKVDRQKLYGQRRRIPEDPSGRPCTRAELSADGALLLRPGMSGQGYFDPSGEWIPHSELVGIEPDGRPAPTFAATLGVPQTLTEVPATELLDHRVDTVYALDPLELPERIKAALENGTLFRFAFSYRGGFHEDPAFLVNGPDGFFALIGQPSPCEWLALDSPPPLVADDDQDDDLDFEMF